MRPLALVSLLAFAACSENPPYTCPDAQATLTGSCTLGQRCAWPASEPGFNYTCVCAGTGTLGNWMCQNFRRVADGGCPPAQPANSELCDSPPPNGCFFNAGGCRTRCDCVPMLGVVTPPRWSCDANCPADAAVTDTPAGG